MRRLPYLSQFRFSGSFAHHDIDGGGDAGIDLQRAFVCSEAADIVGDDPLLVDIDIIELLDLLGDLLGGDGAEQTAVGAGFGGNSNGLAVQGFRRVLGVFFFLGNA